LTRTVADSALVYKAICGRDRHDEATGAAPLLDNDLNLDSDISDLKIAFCESTFFDDVDSEVEDAVRNTKDTFRALNIQVGHIEIPEVNEANAIPKRYLEMSVEAYSANKALLDEHVSDLDPIMEWMIEGKDISAPEYFLMMRKRSELKNSIYKTMSNIDAVLAPTVLSTAHPTAIVDSNIDSYYEHQRMYVRNTSLGNYFNLCGISVCCGFSSNGLPIGLMIYAKPYDEEVVLRVANAYEKAAMWNHRRPDLSWIESNP
jgi:aspartyl-tRNA(Asn)/glutamyl-tRNA(Gln) amidotransferase subunit A